MINMDMVGRLDKDKNLTVGGVGSSPYFPRFGKKSETCRL